MNIKPVFVLLLLVTFMNGTTTMAQAPSPYTVPDAYRFDYAVEQSLSHKKNAAEPTSLHFFYTKSGDYAAARFSGKKESKGNLFIVMTKDGMVIVFDERRKDITIISIRKISSDLMSLTKWIRMDSLMAHMQRKPEGKGLQSAKTGNTRQLNGYTSDEYSITDSKGHKGSVWCTRVDFLTQGDYIKGAIAGNWLNMMMTNQQSAHPLFQALMQPKTLLTEVNMKDSSGNTEMEMHTVSISPVSTSVSTTGYTVNDYSAMTLPEIFQAEMRKRNN
jgi:hypothetical protein